MAVKCIFLGWDQPGLLQVVRYLVEDISSGVHIDLSDQILVLPGARAGRRLLELLLEHAEEQGTTIAPPEIITVGQLPENLYNDNAVVADEMTRRILWAKALRDIPSERLETFFNPLPELEDELAWQNLGDYISQVHDEVAGELLLFKDIAEQLEAWPDMIDETERWEVLGEVQGAYRLQLESYGLVDPRLQQMTLANSASASCDSPITLVGISQLPPLIRKMFEGEGLAVTSLIMAPEDTAALPCAVDMPETFVGDKLQSSTEDMSEPFDWLGCANIHYWSKREVPLADGQIHFTPQASVYPEIILGELAGLDEPPAADDITIGLLDESAKPYLQEHLPMHGVNLDDAAGQSIEQSRIVQLLTVVGAFLDNKQFTDFASLLRHPDVERYVGEKLEDEVVALSVKSWQSILDDYYASHLQASLNGRWLGEGNVTEAMGEVWKVIHEALGELADSKCRTVQEFAEPLSKFLTEMLGSLPLKRTNQAEAQLIDSCEHISNALNVMHGLDESLEVLITPGGAIRMLLKHLSDTKLPLQATDAAVQMLGWLELPFDDAPHLFLVGLNEGLSPKSINEDPLLPNGIRTRLGLADNTHRYARDVYLINVMLHSRENVQALIGRWNARKEPMLPSRLLFACDEQTMVRRALHLFDEKPERQVEIEIPKVIHPGQRVTRFVIPSLPKRAIPTVLSVTAFRDYLDCPYRFYLKRILKLNAADDIVQELTPMSFGNLAHEVLYAFGKSDFRNCTNASDICDYLDSVLYGKVKGAYGNDQLPAVRIQVVILQQRLHAFGVWQAERAMQGWEIKDVEVSVLRDGAAPFEVDEEVFGLSGRIDRVDYHAEDGVMIWDYKTSDTAKSPEQTHQVGPKGDKRWVDLQLPLYRHLGAHLGYSSPVRMGYIVLPKDVSMVGGKIARWSIDDLKLADDTARDVIRKIRACEFEVTDTPPTYDDYAVICQQQFEMGSEDEEGGEV